MAALPPRDAINTQIATTKFLERTPTNIDTKLASRFYYSPIIWKESGIWESSIVIMEEWWKCEFIEFRGMGNRIFLFFSPFERRIDCKGFVKFG